MTSIFLLHGHYISSPNQTSPPEPFAEAQPLTWPHSPTDLKNHRWSLDGYPYLAFCDNSPFQGDLFALLAGSVGMPLKNDRHGWHIPHETAKSWKELEHTLRRIAKHLKEWFQAASPNVQLFLIDPQIPSKFGYFSAHNTEDAARLSLRISLDAFAVYFAYVSFLAALCQFTGRATETPAWLICLEPPDDIPPELLDICKKLGIVKYFGKRKRIGQHPDNVHPEFLRMFKESHIVDFSGQRTRAGIIIEVLNCGWSRVADVLLKANVPIWLDWGDHPLTINPRASWMMDFRPSLGDLNLLPVPPVPQSPPRLSACEVIARRRSPRDQLPGETCQQYLIRRKTRYEARMKTETSQDRKVRADRERAAAGRDPPGRKGPTVYYWEPDRNGFRVRTLQTRGEVKKLWGMYSGSQKIFDSFANEWDCCTLFGDDDPDTDEDNNISPLTASNYEEPTPDLPPPCEESTSNFSLMTSLENEAKFQGNLDAQPVPYPFQNSVSLLSSCHEETPNPPPPLEESNLSLVTNLEDEAKSQGIPMNLDAQPVPPPPRNPVSLESSYHGRRPTLSRGDRGPMHYYRRRDPRNDSPNRDRVHRRNTRNNSPGRYHEHRRSRDMEYRRPYRDSRGDSPRRYHHNHSQDPLFRGHSPMRHHNHYSEDHRPRHNNPRHYYKSDRDGGDRSMHRRSRSRSRGPYQRSDAMVDSDPRKESDDGLLALSRAVVLSVHPPDPTILFGIQTDSLEDHVYYRFGFHLDENPYTDIPSSAFSVEFSGWVEARRSIGCHQLDCSPAYRRPIQHFLQCLLTGDDPLHNVPAKFWDLNVSNSANPNLSAGSVHVEPKKFLDGWCYLIRPVGLHASRDSSWVLAVNAMTALECVRRGLGPNTIDIADFLINRGIPFRTLRPMTSIPAPHTPPPPISNLLGTRPENYRFDVADFSAYQTLCGSVLKGKPFARAALCKGGIVARLAREIIPNTAALLGPSQDALEGYGKIMVATDGNFYDDDVPDPYADLICGVYKVSTEHFNQFSDRSWFPKHNIWAQAGYNVGQWTQACEVWFEDRMAEIQKGGQPLDSHTWRTKLLLSRKATKLVRKMEFAAASFIQAQSFVQ